VNYFWQHSYGHELNTQDNKDLESRNEDDNDTFPKEWMLWLHTKNVDFSSHISAGNELAIWHILSIDEFFGDRDMVVGAMGKGNGEMNKTMNQL
jgi:hypothetical protein